MPYISYRNYRGATRSAIHLRKFNAKHLLMCILIYITTSFLYISEFWLVKILQNAKNVITLMRFIRFRESTHKQELKKNRKLLLGTVTDEKRIFNLLNFANIFIFISHKEPFRITRFVWKSHNMLNNVQVTFLCFSKENTRLNCQKAPEGKRKIKNKSRFV